MTDQKPNCPPCHGNCNQGRTCPNKPNREGELDDATLAYLAVAIPCAVYSVACIVFLAVLFFEWYAQ